MGGYDWLDKMTFHMNLRIAVSFNTRSVVLELKVTVGDRHRRPAVEVQKILRRRRRGAKHVKTDTAQSPNLDR